MYRTIPFSYCSLVSAENGGRFEIETGRGEVKVQHEGVRVRQADDVEGEGRVFSGKGLAG